LVILPSCQIPWKIKGSSDGKTYGKTLFQPAGLAILGRNAPQTTARRVFHWPDHGK